MQQKVPLNDQKKQKKYYSGKHKHHSLKAQVMMDVSSGKVLTTRFCKGAKHDFALFKENKLHIQQETWYVADSGYQGLQKQHAQTYLPNKKPKNKPLPEEHAKENSAIASFRIKVEHVIRSLKIWRILKETYRNRRKRYSLRFNLIAAIFNSELEA